MTDALERIRKIADAVLYEGYILWPYRRSALKNQQRFNFGGVHPAGWPDDRSEIRAECLLRGEPGTSLSVRVRFLHLVDRRLLDGTGEPVDELTAGGERYLSWQESVEREIEADPVPGATAIEIAAGGDEEPVFDGGLRAGTITRSWRELRGVVEVGRSELGPALERISVRIANTAPWEGEPRERALHRTFCSTHIVLNAPEGEFVSLTDPPPELAADAARCENDGTWPVLAGEQGDASTVLAAPIILSDHPEVAPESPGDFFDGGEIDGMLVLNILALTDEEKAEMRHTDPRAREILERTEALTEAELMRLHGTIRERGEVPG